MTKPNDDLNFEIKFYEGLLEKKPDFVEALTLLGDLYTKSGMYKQGLDVDERLASLRPHDAIVYYNLACSYSLLKEIDKAFRSIKHAVNCGYNDFEFMESDADLEHLRNDARFKRYVIRLKSKKSHEVQIDLESNSENLP